MPETTCCFRYSRLVSMIVVESDASRVKQDCEGRDPKVSPRGPVVVFVVQTMRA